MVEGITCVPAVTGRVLLGATASLTWGIACECDDVTGAEHAGCALGAGQAMAFLLSLEGIQRRDSQPVRKSCSRFAPVLVHGARPARHQVQHAGRGMILPVCGPRCRRVHAGPGGVGRGGATRLSSTLGTRSPAKRAGRRCGLQARLDRGPHGVPCGSSLAGHPRDSGSLDA